jgi:hypothetical protein
MKSVAELRAEARRLRETISKISDLELQKELAARALGLAERAEMIARSSESPEIIRTNILGYRCMLTAGITDIPQKRIIEEMLADLEVVLADLGEKAT